MRTILPILKKIEVILNALKISLDNKADKDHDHNLIDLIKQYTQPRFIIKIESSITTAIVTVRLLTSNGYCLDNLLLQIAYRIPLTQNWCYAQSFNYACNKKFMCVLKNLRPYQVYDIKLTVYDKTNPHLVYTLYEQFMTGK